MSGPARAVQLIEAHFEPNFAPTPIRDVLAIIIENENWKDGDQIFEYAERWTNPFRQRLLDESAKNIDLGPTVIFKFSPDLDDHIEGVCHCRPGDCPDLVDQKTKRQNSLLIYQVLKDLDWGQIEVVCRELLRFFGVGDPHAGRGSGDQGIDFFGYSEFGTTLNPILIEAGFERQLRVWFVGQAKHYPNGRISTTQLRELIGTLTAARAKIFAETGSGMPDPTFVPNELKTLDLKLCDPVFAILATTGFFSRDSRTLLRKCGIIAIDGRQLGQFLADRGVGITAGAFAKAAFLDWLAAANT